MLLPLIVLAVVHWVLNIAGLISQKIIPPMVQVIVGLLFFSKTVHGKVMGDFMASFLSPMEFSNTFN